MTRLTTCKSLAAAFLGVAILTGGAGMTLAQQPPAANYDESKIPAYELPDSLTFANGDKVKTAQDWTTKRCAEVLGLFETHVYGKAPAHPKNKDFRVAKLDPKSLDGLATRKEVLIPLTDREDGPVMRALLYTPNNVPPPVPLFMGLNFRGNYTTHADPTITLTEAWVYNDNDLGINNNRAVEAGRGSNADRWPYEAILKRGYGVMTIHSSDIDPDFHDEFKNGIHPYYYKEGQTKPADDEWGSIGAWAWGLSRAMDYIETDRAVDAKRVAVMGHSRLGKTALWAGALDPRFALVVSNQSGCGGAALSRRAIGETIWRINTSFPHWFCGNYKKYNGAENDAPVDQHMLIALIAPRPVLVCSAEGDQWADPKGEYLSAKHAEPVYQLLGAGAMAAEEMPKPNQLVDSVIGYHIRPGKHAVGLADWMVFCDFADKHMK